MTKSPFKKVPFDKDFKKVRTKKSEQKILHNRFLIPFILFTKIKSYKISQINFIIGNKILANN